ncbi:MAG: protoporphyrinogen/coproporphyrinogen oxidase [Candidatus Udaeobacter sp.]
MDNPPNASRIKADTIVIGAGPAGLGAALALGDSAVVLESREAVAGLCGTLTLDGVIFDLGGHSFTTPHPAIRGLVFDALEMEEQNRGAWCWLNGEWVRYPFQQHFSELADSDSRHACRIGLEAASGWRDAANFDEYLDRRFGRGITDLFMRPYNRKLWGADLTRLGTDWVAERVAAPLGTTESCTSNNGRRSPLPKEALIGYPAKGGYGEIFQALAQRVTDLRLGQSVTSIDPRTSTLRTASGETASWRRLISTLPLPALLRLIPNVPAAISSAVYALEVLPITLVMLVLDGRHETVCQRIYCPDENICGHKIVLNHNSSRWLRALPRHGVQVELSEFSPFSSSTNVRALVNAVVGGLLRMAVIPSPDSVRRAEVLRIPFGYPVQTHSRSNIVALAQQWLSEHRIYTVGRFGEWAYINSDEALYRGHCLGTKLAMREEHVPCFV